MTTGKTLNDLHDENVLLKRKIQFLEAQLLIATVQMSSTSQMILRALQENEESEVDDE